MAVLDLLSACELFLIAASLRLLSSVVPEILIVVASLLVQQGL